MIRRDKSGKSKINIIAAAALSFILGVFILPGAAAGAEGTAMATPTDIITEKPATATATATDIITKKPSETEFYVAVDYYAEKIRVLNPNSILSRYGTHDYMEIYDNEGVFGGISIGIGKSDLARSISVAHDGEYMYALRAVSDDILDSYEKSGRNQKKISALQKEKWYPIHGGGIDIEKAIPARSAKSQKRQYYIAIRRADDVFDTENGYKSRVAVLIKPRYNERNLSKMIEYDALREKIILSANYPGGRLNVMYRYDYFAPLSGALAKDGGEAESGIYVPGGLFSLGGTVYISSMPLLEDGPHGPRVAFAKSKEIKFKIPKVPDAPAVRADTATARLTSIKPDSLEWSLTGGENPGAWRYYERSEAALAFADVLNTFAGLDESHTDENGNYAVYFRTRAVEKKTPASLVKKVLIPADLCR